MMKECSSLYYFFYFGSENLARWFYVSMGDKDSLVHRSSGATLKDLRLRCLLCTQNWIRQCRATVAWGGSEGVYGRGTSYNGRKRNNLRPEDRLWWLLEDGDNSSLLTRQVRAPQHTPNSLSWKGPSCLHQAARGLQTLDHCSPEWWNPEKLSQNHPGQSLPNPWPTTLVGDKKGRSLLLVREHHL